MKLSLSSIAIAALLAGCASSVPAVSQPATAPEAPPVQAEEPKPTVIDNASWTLTLPAGWRTDDTPSPNGPLTQLLKSMSPYNVGRGPIVMLLQTTSFDGTPEEFATKMSALSDDFAPGGKVLKTGTIEFDGRPSSATILVSRHALGIIVVGTATGGTGYVLTCGGDAIGDSNRVVKTCYDVMSTFHAK